MSNREQWRNEHFRRRLKPWQKWATVKCGACNGSGHYDHNGSPPCGACDGTGTERAIIDTREKATPQ